MFILLTILCPPYLKQDGNFDIIKFVSQRSQSWNIFKNKNILFKGTSRCHFSEFFCLNLSASDHKSSKQNKWEINPSILWRNSGWLEKQLLTSLSLLASAHPCHSSKSWSGTRNSTWKADFSHFSSVASSPSFLCLTLCNYFYSYYI